jgi:hypothetical protein
MRLEAESLPDAADGHVTVPGGLGQYSLIRSFSDLISRSDPRLPAERIEVFALNKNSA